MSYLGIPVAGHHLPAATFNPVVAKMGKKILPWKGRFNSHEGFYPRNPVVCLINSCLYSLPTYTMGFYLLPKSYHEGFDKHRINFFGIPRRTKRNTAWYGGTSFAGPNRN